MKLQIVFSICSITILKSFICYYFLYLLTAVPKLFWCCEIDNKEPEKPLGIFSPSLYETQELFHQKLNNGNFLAIVPNSFISFHFHRYPLQGGERGIKNQEVEKQKHIWYLARTDRQGVWLLWDKSYPRGFIRLHICLMFLILLGCNYLRMGKRAIFRNANFLDLLAFKSSDSRLREWDLAAL